MDTVEDEERSLAAYSTVLKHRAVPIQVSCITLCGSNWEGIWRQLPAANARPPLELAGDTSQLTPRTAHLIRIVPPLVEQQMVKKKKINTPCQELGHWAGWTQTTDLPGLSQCNTERGTLTLPFGQAMSCRGVRMRMRKRQPSVINRHPYGRRAKCSHGARVAYWTSTVLYLTPAPICGSAFNVMCLSRRASVAATGWGCERGSLNSAVRPNAARMAKRRRSG